MSEGHAFHTDLLWLVWARDWRGAGLLDYQKLGEGPPGRQRLGDMSPGRQRLGAEPPGRQRLEAGFPR